MLPNDWWQDGVEEASRIARGSPKKSLERRGSDRSQKVLPDSFSPCFLPSTAQGQSRRFDLCRAAGSCRCDDGHVSVLAHQSCTDVFAGDLDERGLRGAMVGVT